MVIIQGLLSRNWDAIKIIHLKCTDINENRAVWTSGEIKAIWNHTTGMWKMRNVYVHGHGAGKTKSPKRKELLEQLRTEIERTKERK